MGDVDVEALAPLLVDVAGAEFGSALHTVISPHFVPVQWETGLRSFLAEHPFETNVFCMTRFPQDPDDEAYLDPVSDVLPVIREVLLDHGLVLHLASDRNIVDDMFGNVAAHIWACKFGIGLLEDRLSRGLNYNVMTELGAMLVMGRRCALLKDRTAPPLPSDIGGHIYKPLDFDDLEVVRSSVSTWVTDDLRLSV